MIKSIFSTIGVKLLAAIINFLIIVVLSKYGGLELKGAASQLITVISITQIFCDLIGGSVLVYLTPKYNIRSLLFPVALWAFISSFLVSFIFVWFSLSDLASFDSHLLFHFTLLSFLNALICSVQNMFVGLQKYKWANISVLTQSVIIFSLVFLFLGVLEIKFLQVYMFSLYFAFSIPLLANLILIYSVEDEKPRTSFTEVVRSCLNFGFQNQLGHLIQFLNFRLGYFLIGLAGLGLFSNAVSIGEALWIIPSSFCTILYGKVSNTDDDKEQQLLTSQFFRTSLSIVSICLLILFFIPNAFYIWLFGNEFDGITLLVRCLIPGLFFWSNYLILNHYFSGKGNYLINLYSICAGFLVTVMGYLILVFSGSSIDTYHVALISSASYFVNFVFIFIRFKRKSAFGMKEFMPSVKDIKYIFKELKNTNS